ncbi:MAG: HEAT repeat domain-containing protein [Chloroflexota bacterium]
MNTLGYLLTDEQMQAYIVNGYLSVQIDLPTAFHTAIYKQAETIFGQGPNPWNDIYPLIPELVEVFAHPAVVGALTSILGRGYIMHPHRHCHLNRPGTPAQGQHKDSYEEDENVRHHRTRWAMAFYYPQDVTVEMGPSAIQPGTQYYNTRQEAQQHQEIALTGKAGTVTIIHYDLWHRALANQSDQQRFMMKFLFCRMEEPAEPSWNSQGSDWVGPANGSASPVQGHDELWQRLWQWHMGWDACQETQHGSGTPNGDKDILTEEADALLGQSEAQRLNAAYRLACLGEAAVPTLMDALVTESTSSLTANLKASHTNPSELYSAHGLAAVGQPTIPALIEVMESQDWWLRAAAANILGNMGLTANPAIRALTSALQDESEWVRRNAVESLGILGARAKSAVLELARVLADEDELSWVRHNAALALARMGAEAAPARPILESVLTHEDLYISGNAKIALERMTNASTASTL